FQAEDGIRDFHVTGVQTCALPIYEEWVKKGYFTKGELGLEYADMLNQFVTGKAGMMFDGSWRASVFKDPSQAGELTGQVGFFPKIGRASCRERVWVSVEDGALKKK